MNMRSVILILCLTSFLAVLAAAADLPLRLDFDCAASPDKTMNGFTGFNPQLYDAGRGYGWDGAVSSYYYWTYDFLNLIADMHYSSQDRTFKVDLPNGGYTVKMYFQGYLSGSIYADDFRVSAEGNIVFDHVDAAPHPNVKIVDVSVADGQLDLLFHDNGGASPFWIINGLEIYAKIVRPEISGLQSGSGVIHGNSIVIAGVNFGSKEQALPLKWDTFESGVDGADISSLSDWSSWGEGVHAPKYKAGSENRPGSLLCSEHKMGPGDYVVRNSRLKYWTDKNTDKIFAAFWTKYNWGRNIVLGADSYSYQLKFWRLTGGNGNTSNWIDSPAIICSNWKQDFGKPTEYANRYYTVRCGTTTDYSDYYSSDLIEDGKWFMIQIQMKQSDINEPNGGFSVWYSVDGGPIVNVANNWDILTREIPAKITGISLGEWLGDLVDGETENYFDDVYFDNSWARVEIGDASTWDACAHREIQAPTAWADNAVTITFNKGSFSNGDPVYFYIIDQDGSVNLYGYPATIGGADSPAAPAGLTVH